MSQWATVITKPLSEAAAEMALQSRGWRVYLPRYRKILRGHRRGARGEAVLRPLFPRYLFAELRPQWSGIANVPGVLALVGGMVDGCWRPYLLAAEVIEEIRQREHAGEWDESREGRRLDLVVGGMVAIPELDGMLGRLMGLGEDDRARVLIEILGRTVPATVRASGLVAAVA